MSAEADTLAPLHPVSPTGGSQTINNEMTAPQ
jgi:hypothetical protein